MITNTGKRRLACRRNASGILVYIPEKIRIDGSVYIVPYAISMLAYTAPRYSVSPRSIATIPIKFGSTEVVLYEPFSKADIKHYISAATMKRNSSAGNFSKLIMAKSTQSPDMLDPKKLVIYNAVRSGKRAHDSMSIIYLRAGKLTPI